jgi:hypothetical protein
VVIDDDKRREIGMKMLIYFLTTVAVLVATVMLSAQTPRLSPPENAAMKLENFSWLTGQWNAEAPFGRMESYYSPPRAGQIIGMWRLVTKDSVQKVILLEMVVFNQTENGIELRVRHFDPKLAIDDAEKESPIILRLASYDGKTAVFDNPINNRPKRTFLTRVDSETMNARSVIISASGDTSHIDVTYHRSK